MRSLDPYFELGIARTASASEVKEAYRRLAKVKHPDAGGTAEDFDKLSVAMKVLSDEARRAKYDATGQIDETGIDKNEADALQLIGEMIRDVLFNDAIKTQVDLITAMRQVVMKQIAEMDIRKASIRAALGKAEKKAKRFRFIGKTGPNRIALMVEFMMTAEQAKIEKIDAALVPLKRAVEILRDYEFEPEKLEEALFAGDPNVSSPTRPRNAAADRGPSIPENL
jgi:curved DNA-binding protein CbpA